MYDTYVYLAFDRGYFIVATEIVNSRYLTQVLAAAYGSFGLSDALTGAIPSACTGGGITMRCKLKIKKDRK